MASERTVGKVSITWFYDGHERLCCRLQAFGHPELEYRPAPDFLGRNLMDSTFGEFAEYSEPAGQPKGGDDGIPGDDLEKAMGLDEIRAQVTRLTEGRELFERATALWGSEAQWRQLQEECGELIAAINRAARGRRASDEIGRAHV
mgnify:CR=1 FL=1